MRKVLWELSMLFAIVAAVIYFGQVAKDFNATKSAEVTFADVKPIFEFNCKYCHHQKVWDWTDYGTAFAKKDLIRQRVWVLRNMPLGREMPESDRARIRDWVDQGAKK